MFIFVFSYSGKQWNMEGPLSGVASTFNTRFELQQV